MKLKYSPLYDACFAELTPERIQKSKEYVKKFPQEKLEDYARALENFFPFSEEITIYFLLSGPRSFSDPLTVVVGEKSVEEVLLVAVHELVHRVQEPITKTSWYQGLHADRLVRNHIITYALLKEVLTADEFELHTRNVKNKKYLEALRIVEERGSKEILEEAQKRLE